MLLNGLTSWANVIAAHIDYRYADGRFTMSPRGVITVSNQNYLSTSETLRVNTGIQKWKSTCLNQRDVRNLLLVSVSHISEEQLMYN